MDIDIMLKSKIGQVFTLSTGEKVKVVNGFTCYEADYLEVIYIENEAAGVDRINIFDTRILESPDFE